MPHRWELRRVRRKGCHRMTHRRIWHLLKAVAAVDPLTGGLSVLLRILRKVVFDL